MSGTKLLPEKITSPFQLMAAWFSMLVLLVSVLLTAAINITKPDWASGYLVVFTSFLIVIVLGCVTLMLTVFRPNLQEGKEYAQWLKDKNSYSPGVVRSEQISVTPRIRRKVSVQGKRKNIQNNFPISVTNAPGASALVLRLRNSGFSAEIYREPFLDEDEINSFDEHESIWVGSELLAEGVIKSIKIAVEQWPHLKYMQLSNDGSVPPDEVHYQMYFGGASSTAKEYELLPWSNAELMGLDESMSQDAFHKLIRSKYP